VQSTLKGVFLFVAHDAEDQRQAGYYYSATIGLSDSQPALPDLLQATFPARRLQYEAKKRKQLA
jgi:hypothetical protein